MRLTGKLLSLMASLSLASGAMAQTGTAPAPAEPPAYVQPQPPRPPLEFDAARVPDPKHVLALLDYSAAAQMRQLREAPMRLTGGGRGLSSNWISATFLIGLTQLSRVSNAAGSTEFMRQTAEHFNFGLLGGYAPRAMIDADNIAIGALYQELYARSGEAGEIMPLRQRLDYNLPHLMLDPAPKNLVWWWCDALFMAPPVLARASVQTGDPSYLQAMDVQWWRNYDRLWSAEHGLYLRDERFATRKSSNGKPIFWGRGNGWVMAGLVRVLESMPADFPSRPRYIATLRTMAAALVKLQRREDGLWTTSLLDPLDPSGPESSGSAFYTYALAWGINHGVLDRATYLPHVLRAWSGLAAIVQPNGLLGYAQRTGDQPEPSTANDTALYGTGALLLAGTEVMKLAQPVTGFPVAEPQRDPPSTGPLRLPIAYRDPPAGATAGGLAGYRRVMAERQAMIDLAYDPRLHGPGADAPPPVPGPNGIAMPRMTVSIPPPPEAERKPRATVSFAPYRYDDLLWENDRTAHRIYGPALEAAEPPSSSGIDAWGKHVVWPFMERQLKSGKQHDYHGEGIDFYNVNTFRGAGGLGIWANNKLWVSRNFAKYRILKDGPDVADFEVDYAPWPVDVDRKAWETRRFTLPLGTNFTRLVSTINSDREGPMVVGIGISKRATSMAPGRLTVDRAKGRLSFWGPTDPDKGTMAVALMVDPAMIADIKEDADNYLVLLNVTPGKPFVYYMGAAWDKSGLFADRAAWEDYVARQTPDFNPRR